MNKIESSKIIVTGGAGFVGSFIVEQLLQEGAAEIVIIDNMIRGTRRNIESSLATGKVRLVEGVIEDEALLRREFQGADYCFHMAALRITQCVAEPVEALKTMYVGTFQVIEACLNAKVKKLVAASTASVYGTADIFPTKEDHHPYNNRTLYGAAKMANELMYRAFNDMVGLNYCAHRFFNIYGPRMDTHGKYTEVLIRWYRLLKEGKEPIIFGDGKQTMDFVYVEDVARACVLSLVADVSDEVFNIARGEETSLEGLCYGLIEAMGLSAKPQYIPLPDERKKVEVLRRLADTSKAKELLGFTATVSLKDGLKHLVAWLDELHANEAKPLHVAGKVSGVAA